MVSGNSAFRGIRRRRTVLEASPVSAGGNIVGTDIDGVTDVGDVTAAACHGAGSRGRSRPACCAGGSPTTAGPTRTDRAQARRDPTRRSAARTRRRPGDRPARRRRATPRPTSAPSRPRPVGGLDARGRPQAGRPDRRGAGGPDLRPGRRRRRCGACGGDDQLRGEPGATGCADGRRRARRRRGRTARAAGDDRLFGGDGDDRLRGGRATTCCRAATARTSSCSAADFGSDRIARLRREPGGGQDRIDLRGVRDLARRTSPTEVLIEDLGDDTRITVDDAGDDPAPGRLRRGRGRDRRRRTSALTPGPRRSRCEPILWITLALTL